MKNPELYNELIKATKALEKDSCLEEDVTDRVKELLLDSPDEELKEIFISTEFSEVILNVARKTYSTRKLKGKILKSKIVIPKEMLEFFEDDFLASMDNDPGVNMQYLEDGSGVVLDRDIPAEKALEEIANSNSIVVEVRISEKD